MGSIASRCRFLGEASLFLTKKLIEKLLENLVGHDAGVGISLALTMKDSGGRLVDAVGLAERVIFVDGGIERATLHERANLGHFRARENGAPRPCRAHT